MYTAVLAKSSRHMIPLQQNSHIVFVNACKPLYIVLKYNR